MHNAGSAPLPTTKPLVWPKAAKPREWMASRARWIAAAEVVGVFAACNIFLWAYSQQYRAAMWLLVLFMLGSVLLRRESAERLGLSFRHTRGATRWLVPGVAFAAVPLFAFGAAEGRIGLLLLPDRLLLLQFTGYFAWCVLQQFALQSYMHNRLLTAVGNSRRTPLLIGLIFGALHLPNPVLTVVCLVGGTVMGAVFLRHRSIWILALGQALIGMMLFSSLPEDLHGRMRVGPGYHTWAAR
jgi:hypothetical protein